MTLEMAAESWSLRFDSLHESLLLTSDSPSIQRAMHGTQARKLWDDLRIFATRRNHTMATSTSTRRVRLARLLLCVKRSYTSPMNTLSPKVLLKPETLRRANRVTKKEVLMALKRC